MKKLVVLGSTGSIGIQVLEIVRAFPEKLQVIGLAGGKNTSLLTEQVQEFKPRWVYNQNNGKNNMPQGDYQFIPMEEMVSFTEVDMVVIATEGKVGLLPLMRALESGKKVALANKEPLVMAGEIVIKTALDNKSTIMPVDSEHSAIWQCLAGEKSEIKRLILTASGGPFRLFSKEQLAKVTPEQALKHPTWKMGKKVTIDSATLMNKGLESIEAHWLFSVPLDRIDAVLHPQSIVHSMVEFIDGSIKAQISIPDMRFPIQFALSFPERWGNPSLPPLDLRQNLNLEFLPLDIEKFPCFKLALEAGRRGGTAPAVLCGADEMAVQLFLAGKASFTDIPGIVEKALHNHPFKKSPTMQEILKADEWAREYVCKGVRF